MDKKGLAAIMFVLGISTLVACKGNNRPYEGRIVTAANAPTVSKNKAPEEGEIERLYFKVPRSREERKKLISSLEERLQRVEQEGDYSRAVKDAYSLANVFAERPHTSDRALELYKKVIGLIERYDVEGTFMDDAYLGMGDILVGRGKENSNSAEIRKGIMAYLDGLMQNGDRADEIMWRITETYYGTKKDVRAAISKYVNGDINLRMRMYDIFSAYSKRLGEGIKNAESGFYLQNTTEMERLKKVVDDIIENVLPKVYELHGHRNNNHLHNIKEGNRAAQVALKAQYNKILA
jgi:hypothetical protein